MGSSSVHDRAAAALRCPDLDEKVALTDALARDWAGGRLLAGGGGEIHPVDAPGRPCRPVLVEPRQLRARKLSTPAGRIAAVHAVAHIEANAINLALDAVQRFRDLPPAYYRDWLSVATDEGRHFLMLRERLRALGADYGDLPAHDGLWTMAVRTAGDPLHRMALVPRVLEARGLDVTPGMIDRFRAAGDLATAALLEVILAEEVEHVAVGTRWFVHLCREAGVDPETTFTGVLADAGVGVVPPLNVDARRRAGFSEEELAGLAASATGARSMGADALVPHGQPYDAPP